MLRLDRLHRCPRCSGDLQPLSVCPECKSTTVADLLNLAGPEIACARCGTRNPTRFVCMNVPRTGSTYGEPPAPACSSWYSYEEVSQRRSPPEDPHSPPAFHEFGGSSAKTALAGHRAPRDLVASCRRGLLTESPSWSRFGLPAHRPTEVKRKNNGPVNAPGRVNGLVNGRGVPNGTTPGTVRPSRGRLDPRYLMIGAALLMAAAIGLQLVYPPPQAPEISIDGSFEDWSGVPVYAEGTYTSSPNVRIRSVSLKLADASLFFRVEVAGSALADPADYDTIHGFLDVDGNLTTGYDLGELGAEYLARVSGSGGLVEQAVLMRFEGNDSADWNGWRTVVDLPAAANGRQIEVAIPTYLLGEFAWSSLRARFAADDNAGETSHTVVPIGLALGALRVTQEVLATTLRSGPQPFLGLRFDAFGGGARVYVQRVELRTSAGAAFASIPEDFEVVEGSPVHRVVTADPMALPLGSLVSAGVASVAADRPFAVVGFEARAYVGQPPTENVKRIDGLFAEWPTPTSDQGDFQEVSRSSMDIVSWDASADEDQVFLYVRLLGPALEGSLVPDRMLRHRSDGEGVSGTSTSPRPPPPRVGRDYVRFYLGMDEGGGGIALGGRTFNRLVDVQGRGGRVDNASAYRWSGTDWEWEAAIETGLGAEELEAGARIENAASEVQWILVATADWSGIADATEPEESEGTRGSPGLIPLHGTNALTALAKPLTNVPTVDGNCGTSSNEYQGADELSNANLKFLVGRRSATSRLYVCLEVTADTTDDGAVDSGRLVFDRNHDGGSSPQSDDRRFRVTSGGSLTSEKGNGAGWVSCSGSCYSPSAVGAFNNSRQVYEFSVSFWDVWGTNSTTVSQVAGFAVLGFDDTTFTTYTWGSDNVNQNNPGTWGHLQIPEFPSMFVAGILVLSVVLARKRLKGRGSVEPAPVRIESKLRLGMRQAPAAKAATQER